MSFRFHRRVRTQPTTRIEARQAGLHLTAGAPDFWKFFLRNRLYWASPLPGFGRFVRPPVVPPTGPDGPFDSSDPLTILRPPRPARRTRISNRFDPDFQRYRDLLDLWRILPVLPEHSEFASATSPSPYRPLRPEPVLDLGGLEDEVVDEVVATLSTRLPWSLLPGPIVRWAAAGRISRRWQTLRRALEQQHQDLLADRATLEPADREGWAEAEVARTTCLRRLLDNDAEAVLEETAAVVSQIALPQEMTVDILFDDPSLLHLIFQLPELENVILTSSRELLRNGEVRKIKREKEELHREFCAYAVGQAIHLAAFVFSRLPLVQEATLAVHTPTPTAAPPTRRRSARTREARPDHQFIFEVPFERRDFLDPDLESFDPVLFLHEHGARMNQLSNVALGRIDPPSWLDRDQVPIRT